MQNEALRKIQIKSRSRGQQGGSENVCVFHREQEKSSMRAMRETVYLTIMFVDCGRKPEYPEKPTHARGELANSFQEAPRPGFKPRTFLLQCMANNCATVQFQFYY
ncbi:hypothetical protein CHARACLAT_026205 [Characodon lateralis]|uniref:Uncharacterized protein n=1 Tax=Characodon lateralis TaxID=208331 RepID=A0ABU7EMD9_9TELE|nr:hypothetical protein [Characodon lateralis]